jgi:hypothetical protein
LMKPSDAQSAALLRFYQATAIRRSLAATLASLTSGSRVAVDRPSRINDARNCIVAMQQ